MKKIFLTTILLVLLVIKLPVFANQQLNPSTFNSSTNTIHIPYFKFGGNNYWLDLKLVNDNPLQFQLIDYGQNSNVEDCEACATFDTENLILMVPYFEFNGNKYWLTFKLESSNPIIFTFLSFGVSQVYTQNYTDSVTDMEFVKVKGGCYKMGQSDEEKTELIRAVGNEIYNMYFNDERPVHTVCVDDFYIGKYEVTQGQWKKITGNNPSYFSSCGDNCPVESVSWDDVQEFIRELNNQTGKNFRLPTEAEWEYAAKSGGKNGKYAGGNDIDTVAWYSNNSGKITHPVGQKQSNGLGIYDMSGNVWEWVNDWYGEDYYVSSPTNNPQGPSLGSERALRGGSCGYSMNSARAANRYKYKSNKIYNNFGFRLALSVR